MTPLSRSFKLIPFQSLGAGSNSPLCYLVSFTRYSDLFENREFFYTPLVFSAPAGGDPVGISRRCLILIKLDKTRMIRISCGEESMIIIIMLRRFHTGTQRTDGQTEIIAISISRVSMLTRVKKLRCMYVEADCRQTRSIVRPLCDS